MSIKKENLSLIATEYLFKGMEIKEDIFNQKGEVLLIAKGIILTELKIQQLRKFNASSRNISVYPETYKTLMDHGLLSVGEKAQQCLEEETGYTKIKEETFQFLVQMESTDLVSMHEAESISQEIFTKLYTIDPAQIFQCINVPNPMDEYLRRHSVNVGLLNGLMGKWLNLPDEEISMLVLAGLVHDVGKTKIPQEILNAPRRLSRSEFEVIKQHTIFSYELLSKDKQFPMSVKMAALHHHEKMNGDGYPDGYTADEIPLFARITAVSDIYDAMVSKRSYKESNNPFSILSRLEKQQFSDLDITLVQLFTSRMPLELMGSLVLLTDGSIGKIKYINPNDLENPLVEVNGVIKKTNEKLYCKQLVT